MGRFILRRILLLIPILLGVTFLTFLLISLSPGDYLSTVSLNPAVSAERIEELRTEFGLDRPWYIQYGYWLYRLSPYEFPFGLKWPDFGYSFSNRLPVLSLMGDRFWNTLLLSSAAEILVWLIAIPLALFLTSKRHSWVDSLLSSFLFLGISFPQLLLALLALLFAARTGWFPVGGMRHFGTEMAPFWYRFGDVLHHMILPVAVLALTEIAALVRYARRSMIDMLSEPFVQTALAKGLKDNRVLLSHVFPNSVNPLLTLFGLSFANLLSASFVVEIVMGWPGLGRLAYDAMLSKDLYLLMASLIAGTILLVLGNLLSDVLLAFSDPRIRHE